MSIGDGDFVLALALELIDGNNGGIGAGTGIVVCVDK
jgi:hypothetical protein